MYLDTSKRLSLSLVFLDVQGYAFEGREYFGNASNPYDRIYEAQDHVGVKLHVRATSRAAAKLAVQQELKFNYGAPLATFLR